MFAGFAGFGVEQIHSRCPEGLSQDDCPLNKVPKWGFPKFSAFWESPLIKNKDYSIWVSIKASPI